MNTIDRKMKNKLLAKAQKNYPKGTPCSWNENYPFIVIGGYWVSDTGNINAYVLTHDNEIRSSVSLFDAESNKWVSAFKEIKDFDIRNLLITYAKKVYPNNSSIKGKNLATEERSIFDIRHENIQYNKKQIFVSNEVISQGGYKCKKEFYILYDIENNEWAQKTTNEVDELTLEAATKRVEEMLPKGTLFKSKEKEEYFISLGEISLIDNVAVTVKSFNADGGEVVVFVSENNLGDLFIEKSQDIQKAQRVLIQYAKKLYTPDNYIEFTDDFIYRITPFTVFNIDNKGVYIDVSMNSCKESKIHVYYGNGFDPVWRDVQGINKEDKVEIEQGDRDVLYSINRIKQQWLPCDPGEPKQGTHELQWDHIKPELDSMNKMMLLQTLQPKLSKDKKGKFHYSFGQTKKEGFIITGSGNTPMKALNDFAKNFGYITSSE